MDLYLLDTIGVILIMLAWIIAPCMIIYKLLVYAQNAINERGAMYDELLASEAREEEANQQIRALKAQVATLQSELTSTGKFSADSDEIL